MKLEIMGFPEIPVFFLVNNNGGYKPADLFSQNKRPMLRRIRLPFGKKPRVLGCAVGAQTINHAFYFPCNDYSLTDLGWGY